MVVTSPPSSAVEEPVTTAANIIAWNAWLMVLMRDLSIVLLMTTGGAQLQDNAVRFHKKIGNNPLTSGSLFLFVVGLLPSSALGLQYCSYKVILSKIL